MAKLFDISKMNKRREFTNALTRNPPNTLSSACFYDTELFFAAAAAGRIMFNVRMARLALDCRLQLEHQLADNCLGIGSARNIFQLVRVSGVVVELIAQPFVRN